MVSGEGTLEIFDQLLDLSGHENVDLCYKQEAYVYPLTSDILMQSTGCGACRRILRLFDFDAT
jgi:hypothetical protein